MQLFVAPYGDLDGMIERKVWVMLVCVWPNSVILSRPVQILVFKLEKLV